MNKDKNERRGLSTYDSVDDIFYSYPLDRKYKESVMIDNFVFDLDANNEVVGVEIVDYSKLLGLSKYYANRIQKGKINIQVNSETIRIEIHALVNIRNQNRDRYIDYERVNKEDISPSSLSCSVVA